MGHTKGNCVKCGLAYIGSGYVKEAGCFANAKKNAGYYKRRGTFSPLQQQSLFLKTNVLLQIIFISVSEKLVSFQKERITVGLSVGEYRKNK
jgi:hypothetical protein